MSMATDAHDIYDAALLLPEVHRAKLADLLVDSLAAEEGMLESDPELKAEIERRLHSYDRGEVELFDWEDVAARIQSKLQAFRAKKQS